MIAFRSKYRLFYLFVFGLLMPAPLLSANAETPAFVERCSHFAEDTSRPLSEQAILVSLCPEQSFSQQSLRARLLLAGSNREAYALIPQLRNHPELYGLARLAALDQPNIPPATTLPELEQTSFDFKEEQFLAYVQLAFQQRVVPGIRYEQRARATAYLALVYGHAFQQVRENLPPFARLLAAYALYFGRQFCQMYWQKRVAGLEEAFQQIEQSLLDMLLQLDQSPYFNDSALLAVERQLVGSYLRRGSVGDRFKQRSSEGPTPADLEPFVHELTRLLDQGWIDVAIDRSLYRAIREGQELETMGLFLHTNLVRRAYLNKLSDLRQHIEDRKKQELTPVNRSVVDFSVIPPRPWAPSAELATDVKKKLAHIPAQGLARQLALALIALDLRERPDVFCPLLQTDEHELDPLLKRWLNKLNQAWETHLRRHRLCTSTIQANVGISFETTFRQRIAAFSP